ncbi:hypothetical protein RB7137 [Rhodopirellula baltica SH 1]|uniref:Uncharacterized protein n=1 Tax=Rhodopirellula baltica (strain DSM 10527 / NCIMB 13988 / SH1) TaxID=243090 RepID=Q7UP60_RHOBA|nr:hypothetical protein RB7137 [Rhodopirellula baltica SH 1]
MLRISQTAPRSQTLPAARKSFTNDKLATKSGRRLPTSLGSVRMKPGGETNVRSPSL